MKYNIQRRLVGNHDLEKWTQSDGDETSTPLPEGNEARRAPFPSTASGALGLLKGRGMRDTYTQISNQSAIPCS